MRKIENKDALDIIVKGVPQVQGDVSQHVGALLEPGNTPSARYEKVQAFL